MAGIMDKMWWNLTNMGWTPTTSKRAATLLQRKAESEGIETYSHMHHGTTYVFQKEEDDE